MFVLWPIKHWVYSPSAREILKRQAEGHQEHDIRRFVIEKMIQGMQDNDKALKPRQAAFRYSIILLLAEAATLVVALAMSR